MRLDNSFRVWVRAWGLESHRGSPSLSEEWTHCRQCGYSRWPLQSVAEKEAAEGEEVIDDLLPSRLGQYGTGTARLESRTIRTGLPSPLPSYLPI